MSDAVYLNHHFLIAMPSIGDESFEKSVVYVYEHNENGAMGLVINKLLQVDLGSVLTHLDIPHEDSAVDKHPVLMGGPVGQEHGFIILKETPKNEPQDQITISASKTTLMEIAGNKGPDEFIVTLGYSAWETGQLEDEIIANNWLIAPYDDEVLFDTPIEQRWRTAAAKIGVNVNHLSSKIGHA